MSRRINKSSEIDGIYTIKQLSVDKENFMKPEKVKSRWRRNSEMETEDCNSEMSAKSTLKCISDNKDLCTDSKSFPAFEIIEENLYLFERKRTKRKKEVRRMLCECSVKLNEVSCGDECLNRLLMIECGSRCAAGEACSNRRFEKKLYAKTQPFKTEKKGFGLKVLEDVSKGSFIIEYVGEMLNRTEFKRRVKHYAKEKEKHYYFMALKIDEIIDARFKANVSRFINHSCNPNCETQKWTVNGELRIGFFAKRDIKAFEELTFDYKLERYGRQAQKCFCESENCKGFIGVSDEITVDIETKRENKNKRKKSAEKEKEGKYERRKDVLEDLMLEEEIEKLSINAGLRNKDDTLMLARLMVRAEDSHSREKLLEIILGTTEVACLRLFLDYHGLTLLWSWMADLKDLTDFKLKKKILKALSLLPVPNRTMLSDSKILNVVEKWASCSSFIGEEHDNIKIKFCDTSDSETERTFSEGEHLIFNNSKSDKLLFTNCDVHIAKTINSLEKSSENSTDVEEFSSNNKTSDTNIRSDEESGDNTLEERDENLEVQNYISHATEIANLAQNLLDSWKDLKETFRIPRREKRNQEIGNGTNISQAVIVCNRNTEIKNTNVRQTTKRNADKKTFSAEQKLHEERREIKVINKRFKQYRIPRSNERCTLYSNKSKTQERRRVQNNFTYLYHFNASNYLHSDNYKYSPPTFAGENRMHHCDPPPLHHKNEYLLFEKNTNTVRASLLPTPGTLSKIGVSPNVINTVSSQPPVTAPPPVIPNVMYSPPTNQLPFLSLPLPAVPPVAPEHTNAISSCPQTNNILPPSHLVGISEVSSPVLPMQMNTSSLECVNYVRTESQSHEGKSFICVESLPTAHESEQQQMYSSAQENGDAPRIPPIKLPPNWKTATDPEGNIYFYHMKTRQTQWDPPGMTENMDVDSTPIYDEPKEHKHESHTRRSHKKKAFKKKKYYNSCC